MDANTLTVPLLLVTRSIIVPKYNATTDADNIIGVDVISGQYGTLNRLLLYVLWVVVILARENWSWIAVGSLAYIMTYSATASVHALVLAITSARGIYDLDIPASWALLSTSILMATWLSWYSVSIRNSKYRPIFGFWTTVVALGTICAMVGLNRTYPQELACYSTNSENNMTTLLSTAGQLSELDTFNCTYSFFGLTQATRNPSDIAVVSAERVLGPGYTLLRASMGLTTIFGVVCGIFEFVLLVGRKPTKANLIPVANHPVGGLTSGGFKDRARKKLEQGSNMWLLLNPLVAVVVIVFNELYILKKAALPVSEAAFMVGQWAPWVTVGLTLIAAAINKQYEVRWRELQGSSEAASAQQSAHKSKMAKASSSADEEMALEEAVNQSRASGPNTEVKELAAPDPVAQGPLTNNYTLVKHR